MNDQKNETTNPDTPLSDGEGLAQQLIHRVSELEADLARATKTIARVDRRRAVERALALQQAKDVAMAADLVDDDTETDPQQLARELRRAKPGLFKTGPGGGASATTVPAAGGAGNQQLVVLREKARQGDRASLLLYLRARRADK